MALSLLSIGEVMAEIRRSETGELAVGFAGDTFNTAVYCARLLKTPGRVAYMTQIGSDPLSKMFVNFADGEAISTDFVVNDTSRNIGIYAVETDHTGERSFAYWRERSAAREMFSDTGGRLSLPETQVIYLSGITLAILFPEARENLLRTLRTLKQTSNTMVAFDSNYRPALWENARVARAITSEMWEMADIALPSIDDEMTLFEETSENQVIERFAAMNTVACAIKRGDRGPISPKLSPSAHPNFPRAENVIDTTAAGDSFNGAYLAAFLSGENPLDCMKAGHTLATKVVGVPGAIAART